MKLLLPFFLFLGFAVLPGTLRGEPRTFTNTNGQTIEAELLDVVGEVIRIRRVSDKMEFVIPVKNLSPEDQEFLRTRNSELAKEPIPSEWRILTIHLPTPRDSISIVGCSSSLVSSRHGASSWRVLLPVGGWVRLSVASLSEPGTRLDHMVRFRGGKEWRVFDDGPYLYVARDSAEPKLVGVSLPLNQTSESPRIISKADRSKLDREISIDLPRGDVPEGLADLVKDRDPAFLVGSLVKTSAITNLLDLEPAALYLTLNGENFEEINRLDRIEALELFLNWQKRDNGDREEFPADQLKITPVAGRSGSPTRERCFYRRVGNSALGNELASDARVRDDGAIFLHAPQQAQLGRRGKTGREP